MRHKYRSVLGTVVLISVVAGCGGSSGTPRAGTKADWTRQHGAALTAVGMELDLATTALAAGDRQAILGACTLLRDDAVEARKGVPVPDATVDSAVRRGLDAVDLAAGDCLRGARIASAASINEKAMAELADARTKLNTTNQALASWR